MSGYGPIAPGVITGVPGGVEAGRMTPGLSEEAAAAQEARAEMRHASRAGATGLPAGAGAERRDRERTRRSWLSEDEKLWTGDVRAAPELIVGDTEPDDEAVDEPLRIDLSDDDDKAVDDLFDELSGEVSLQDPQEEIAELRAKLARLEQQTAAGTDSPEPPGPIIGEAG
ncbi:hypothetical protein [Actinoallomurus iriomotensis]|uniref:hypothetical protein n=1 Tax=Actinoallomurus iriomotensis TaxID=478107 RepID=UPI002556294D|nr:hypothetical protein [Actinoallomurus iriomotensis]